MAVAQHLHFDVARIDHAFFQKYFRLAERLAGFRNHPVIIAEQFFFVIAAANAAPAAAIGGLEHDGVTDLFRQNARLFDVCKVAFAARHAGDAGGDHGVARLDLVAHLADHIRIRADKLDVASRADFRQFRILRKKAVAGMQRIAARCHGDIDDVMCIQVAGNRLGTEVVGFVSFLDMQRMAIGIRINGDRLDAHFRARTHNADSYLSSVGDEYFFNHREYPIFGTQTGRL